ncbi:MAG: hypothetical protein IJ593_05900 [Lachnospiraceae bacterium]|nr:hypothetical protein [Lachnospiraceae bacterium]
MDDYDLLMSKLKLLGYTVNNSTLVKNAILAYDDDNIIMYDSVTNKQIMSVPISVYKDSLGLIRKPDDNTEYAGMYWLVMHNKDNKVLVYDTLSHRVLFNGSVKYVGRRMNMIDFDLVDDGHAHLVSMIFIQTLDDKFITFYCTKDSVVKDCFDIEVPVTYNRITSLELNYSRIIINLAYNLNNGVSSFSVLNIMDTKLRKNKICNEKLFSYPKNIADKNPEFNLRRLLRTLVDALTLDRPENEVSIEKAHRILVDESDKIQTIINTELEKQ